MCRSGQQNAHEFGGCIRRGSFVRALSILDEALGMPLKGTWDCWRQVVSSDGSKRQLPSRQREGAGVWSSVKRYSPFEFVDLPLSRMPEGGRLTRPAAYFRRFAQLQVSDSVPDGRNSDGIDDFFDNPFRPLKQIGG